MEEYNANPFMTTRSFTVKRPDQAELEKRINDTFDQLPVLKEEVKRLTKRIEATDSISEAFNVAKQFEISTDNALIVLNTVKQILSKEKLIIEERVKDASKR